MITIPDPAKAVPIVASVVILAVGLLVGGLADRSRLTPLPTMAALVQPLHLIAPVYDVDQSARWYEQTLGFRRISMPDAGKPGSVFLIRDENVLELKHGVGPARLGAEALPFFMPQERIAILVDDVETATKDLREKNVLVLEGPRPARSRDLQISLVQDFNGHVLELQEPQ